jgi:quercetin dioxygenase-like cupin family protein
VLEGELIFQVDEELATKSAGERFFAPRNVAHTLANHSVCVTLPVGGHRGWTHCRP